MTVLVVEDDNIIREGLQISLRQDGYDVLTAATQKEALDTMSGNQTIDIFLLDVMLPDGDGYTICREIRKKSDAPILFLTACDDEVHTVLALEQGADDYIAKPYSPKELVLRVKNIIKRVYSKDFHKIKYNDYEINTIERTVYYKEEKINLTTLEFDLLLYLVNNKNKPLTREMILNEVWGSDYYGSDRVVDDSIRRLRKKLNDLNINTVYGFGYRLS